MRDTRRISGRMADMRQIVAAALGVLALGAAGCANTSGGSATPAADTAGGGQDTATGNPDTGGSTDTTSPGTDTGGTPDTSAGAEKTIAQIQQESTTCDDNKIVNSNAFKGLTVRNVVVTSPIWVSKSIETLYVQDKGGGPWSGMLLAAKEADDRFGDLAPGDVITVIGEAKEFYCLTEMEPKVKVTLEEATELPVALTLAVDDLAAAKGTELEQYEGVLIQVEGVVADPAAEIGTDKKPHALALGKTDAESTVLVGAGFGNYPQDTDGKPNFSKGQKLHVLGFWDYSFKKYKITPLKITVLP